MPTNNTPKVTQQVRNERAEPASKISKRGFASLTPERRSEIARQGGQKAHANGHAHEWSSQEASDAGKIGGKTTSSDREWMSAMGKRGVEVRRQKRAGQLSGVQNGGGSFSPTVATR